MLDKEKGDREKRNELLGNASVVDDAAAAQKTSSHATHQQIDGPHADTRVSAARTSIAQQAQPTAQTLADTAQSHTSVAHCVDSVQAQDTAVRPIERLAQSQETTARPVAHSAQAQEMPSVIAPPTATNLGEAQTKAALDKTKDATMQPSAQRAAAN